MFINRYNELETLKNLLNKKTASLVVLTGRRRIGKSSLIKKFSENFSKFYEFQGLAPNESKIRNINQLENFAEQLSLYLELPGLKFDNWTQAFDTLFKATKVGKKIILLDEISWMASEDPTFLGKLKIAWDTKFKNNPNLIIVLCGSVSGWIENNILKNTNFLGRISISLNIKELSVEHSAKFWTNNLVSNFEKLKVLSVLGGVPRYLEEINEKLPAEKNISRLCFKEGSFLLNEFDRIFDNIFENRSEIYKKIIQSIANGSKTLSEICESIQKTPTGTIQKYLEDLTKAGFISKDQVFKLNGLASKNIKFRLSDNYIRFYLKYISPQKTKITNQNFNFKYFEQLPQWPTIFGLQIENLILNNLTKLQQILRLDNSEIISAAPFYKKSRTLIENNVQIDLLIQTKYKSLYVCEIKTGEKLGIEVVKEVAIKIEKLKYPKYYSVRPVLIYTGEISEELKRSDFFSQIVNIEEFF